MQEAIGHSPDVIFRQLTIRGTDWKAAIIYIDGLVDKTALHEQIMKPLMREYLESEVPKQRLTTGTKIKHWVINSVISVAEIKEVHDLNTCILDVLSGDIALLIDGIADVLIIGAHGWESRSLEEPLTESLVRGPREGFVETLRNNTALLRRRIKDPNFTMINYKVGRRTKKDLVIVYIKGIANEELVEEVKRRVEKINIDDVAESGYVEQLIEDNYLSPFPQIQNTERPDRVMSALMEGRVAILLDGTPFALIVPVSLSMLMSSPEDYYERWIPGSLVRIMRYGGIFIALFLPSLYISLVSYNQGLIPTKLAISIAAGREGVPFPSIIEALMMEISIEVLREAGIRLPRTVGQAVGIVGGLVIGQSAVEAGIVTPIMVVIVALTAISSFAFPQYGAGIAIRILRFGMMISAAVLGLYGVILFFILISVHLVKLKSFGVHYTSSFTPYRPGDWKDMVIRAPLKMMKQRPEMNKTQDHKRQ
jgi:spore germination protein